MTGTVASYRVTGRLSPGHAGSDFRRKPPGAAVTSPPEPRPGPGAAAHGGGASESDSESCGRLGGVSGAGFKLMLMIRAAGDSESAGASEGLGSSLRLPSAAIISDSFFSAAADPPAGPARQKGKSHPPFVHLRQSSASW